MCQCRQCMANLSYITCITLKQSRLLFEIHSNLRLALAQAAAFGFEWPPAHVLGLQVLWVCIPLLQGVPAARRCTPGSNQKQGQVHACRPSRQHPHFRVSHLPYPATALAAHACHCFAMHDSKQNRRYAVMCFIPLCVVKSKVAQSQQQ